MTAIPTPELPLRARLWPVPKLELLPLREWDGPRGVAPIAGVAAWAVVREPVRLQTTSHGEGLADDLPW